MANQNNMQSQSDVTPDKNDKLENWQPDEYVSWSDVTYFWKYGYDFVDKNREKCDRLGVSEDCRCDLCQKELKKNYKTLYWSGDNPASESRWYAHPGPGRILTKIGSTCMKAVEKAHHQKYRENHE